MTTETTASPPARATLPKTVKVLVNPASGSVDAKALDEVGPIFKDHGVDAEIIPIREGETVTTVKAAVEARPDLVVTLAGDGTAGLAATLCGPDGPLVAPLAGGTMNMLPFAIYGKRPWREALADTLRRGEETPISGGEVDGKPFYVAAILGEPARLAYAREAARGGHVIVAARWLRDVWRRAFDSRVHVSLAGHRPHVTEALTVMCPLISKVMDEESALEAVLIDPKGAGEALRLGVRTLFADYLGDWRHDPAVTAFCFREAVAFSNARIPATLDGEPMRLPPRVNIRFKPVAFRAFAAKPMPEPPEAPDLKDIGV